MYPGQSRVRIIPQDWAFSPDNRQIYAWTDSVRYAWTVGSKGQYNSRQYTNIGNAERYVPIIGGSLLYTQYKDQHGERGSPLYDPMFIFQYDSSLTRQCFPWHTSTIRAVVPVRRGLRDQRGRHGHLFLATEGQSPEGGRDRQVYRPVNPVGPLSGNGEL
ncbi:hypothetical protein ACQ86N_01175 [Puia sp. P3]|uniref:hypothetical protein n=1 Tax=Puia sp. P3 TaxID=3423952 RepID=UPI003D675B30